MHISWFLAVDAVLIFLLMDLNNPVIKFLNCPKEARKPF